MKILPIILILIFSFSAFGQTGVEEKALKEKAKTFKQKKQYLIGYDKFADRTTVLFFEGLSSTSSYMWSGTIISFSISFNFEGKTLNKSIDDFYLIFSAQGKDFKFLKNRRLYVIADEERFDFGDGDLDADIRRQLFGNYKTEETLIYKISRADLEKLSKAKSVEIKVSDRIFKLKPEMIEGLKNILNLGTVK